MGEKVLLRIDEVCELLSLRRSFVYRLLQRGELRSVKVGGARRVLLRDLDEFVGRLKDEAERDDE